MTTLRLPAFMKTASWFTKLPDDHKRISISRGTPRRMPAGYRVYRALAPGPWFNNVGIDEYYHLYHTEILAPLDPRSVADDLILLAGGLVPVILCYERPGTGDWCHRAMAAEWLAETLASWCPRSVMKLCPSTSNRSCHLSYAASSQPRKFSTPPPESAAALPFAANSIASSDPIL